MVIHSDKRNKGQVVPICFVGAIKYNDITKCYMIKQTLSITPEQSHQMSLLISHAPEKEVSVSAFSFPMVSDDSLNHQKKLSPAYDDGKNCTSPFVCIQLYHTHRTAFPKFQKSGVCGSH